MLSLPLKTANTCARGDDMTKEQALYSFWSSFQLPAYEEPSIFSLNEAPAFPYITYEVQTDNFGSVVSLSASLWYRTASWTAANTKAREISAVIGMGGFCLPLDEGAMWVKRGSPFSQSMGDGSDDMIKRVVLNIEVEYFTEN